jgi:hypothetical protein
MKGILPDGTVVKPAVEDVADKPGVDSRS